MSGRGTRSRCRCRCAILAANDAATLRETFEREYSVLFRRPIPGAAIEALSWSVLISTKAHRPDAMAPVSDKRAPSPDGSRAFFDGRAGNTIDVPTYQRARLEAGVRVPGPAIIAEDETSTFVTASFDARIDAAGCIVMERRVGHCEPRTRSAPLPLAGRGWGWGSMRAARSSPSSRPPSLTLPRKGGGNRPVRVAPGENP